MRRFLFIPLLAVFALAAMVSPAMAAKPVNPAASPHVAFTAYIDFWSDTSGTRTYYLGFDGCGYRAGEILEITVSGPGGDDFAYIHTDESGCFRSNDPNTLGYYLYTTTVTGTYTASVYSFQHYTLPKLRGTQDLVVGS
jgi:hypothetical protein